MSLRPTSTTMSTFMVLFYDNPIFVLFNYLYNIIVTTMSNQDSTSFANHHQHDNFNHISFSFDNLRTE
jgi:hypothetical protein